MISARGSDVSTRKFNENRLLTFKIKRSDLLAKIDHARALTCPASKTILLRRYLQRSAGAASEAERHAFASFSAVAAASTCSDLRAA